jgi:hypothetical protein
VVELLALRRVHRHHAHAARPLSGGGLLLAQPGVGTAAIERANSRAVACGARCA